MALASNTTGTNNTATGFSALGLAETLFNTGDNNTATGCKALGFNTTGNNNTANGYFALLMNTSGLNNTAAGVNALFSNTTGQGNTANGFNALKSNTTAFNNTANGQGSLQKNTTGGFNTANGFQALLNNTTGSSNIALGTKAGASLTTGSDNIDIGNPGVAGEGNKIRIGTVGKQTATFIAGIRGATTGNANAVSVVIDSAGQLGTVGSSRRFKNEIKPMGEVSKAILELNPVTFQYKSDAQNTSQFGLIAEDVAKVNPDLVARNEDGEIYTVRYEAVNAMLLNEFLKEHGQVQRLEAIVAQQQKRIEALTATIQKVSDQVELSKPASQLVTNR